MSVPFQITLYGTDYWSDLDSDGETLKTNVTGKSDVEIVTIDVYTIKPLIEFETELMDTINYKIASSKKITKTYSIQTKRFNKDTPAEQTQFDLIATVLNKKNVYLEVNNYTRSLHKPNYVIGVVVKEAKPDLKSGYNWYEIELSKMLIGAI